MSENNNNNTTTKHPTTQNKSPPLPTPPPSPPQQALTPSPPTPSQTQPCDPHQPTSPDPSPPLSTRSSSSTLLNEHVSAKNTILHDRLERLRVSFERGMEIHGVDLKERKETVERMVAGRGEGERKEWWVREGKRLEGMVCVPFSGRWKGVGRG